MPGTSDDQKPQIAGAICAPPALYERNGEGNNEVQVLQQPRQPTSLQGLLRFAMDATKKEDAPQSTQFLPMDEERKKFLEEALKAMTVDVMGILQKQIHILKDVSSLKSTDDASKYVEAVQTILDYVDHIDIANDFHKIGGFVILQPCLQCEHPLVRAAGCELLAELCQNNLYCQNIILENEFMPLLLNILQNDENQEVITKGLYALSGIVRHNTEGFNQLIRYKGLDILKKILERNLDNCVTKISFLLSSLCRTQPDLKSRLIFLDYVPILIGLISGQQERSNEHVLSLLMLLVEENVTAMNECKNPKYNLKEILQNYVTSVMDKDEYLEDLYYCKKLLHILYGVPC